MLKISARRVRVLRRAVARTQQVDQFALCGEQLRAVKFHQHLIFFNELTWSIDAEFLHVGGRSRDDAPDSLCFRHDATNRTDAVTKRFHFDSGETDADLLLPLDGDNEFT